MGYEYNSDVNEIRKKWEVLKWLQYLHKSE